MQITQRQILRIEPHVRATRHGWLATSPPGSIIGIGVRADDEAQARRLFRLELEAWADLHSRPERPVG